MHILGRGRRLAALARGPTIYCFTHSICVISSRSSAAVRDRWIGLKAPIPYRCGNPFHGDRAKECLMWPKRIHRSCTHRSHGYPPQMYSVVGRRDGLLHLLAKEVARGRGSSERAGRKGRLMRLYPHTSAVETAGIGDNKDMTTELACLLSRVSVRHFVKKWTMGDTERRCPNARAPTPEFGYRFVRVHVVGQAMES